MHSTYFPFRCPMCHGHALLPFFFGFFFPPFSSSRALVPSLVQIPHTHPANPRTLPRGSTPTDCVRPPPRRTHQPPRRAKPPCPPPLAALHRRL
ncbi:hypothetical protein BKA81DRAFT_361194 [Phyllosticta paracitricarpa]